MKKIVKIIGILISILVLILGASFLKEKFYQEHRKKSAEKIFSKYLETNYTDLEYECTNLRYNVKDDRVYMTLDIKDSEDQDFDISVNDQGEILSDYEWIWKEKEGVYSRFQIYLNKKTWQEPTKDLFGDNHNFDFLKINETDWKSHLPDFDTPIEDLLKMYSIDCIVYVHDVTQYANDELEHLKNEVKKIYKELGIELDSIEIC